MSGVDGESWVGEEKELIIQPRDISGNLVGVSPDRIQVVVTNARGEAEVMELKEVLVDGGGKKKGELVATFVPSVAGEAVVCVLIDGRPVNGFPRNFHVKRRPPKLNIQKTILTGVGETCEVGKIHGVSVFPYLEEGFSIDDVDLERVEVRVWKKGDGESVRVMLEKELGAVVGSFKVAKEGGV